MTISPGEEFRLKATPSQELLRKLAYLATQDNDSVLTGGMKSTRSAYNGSDSERAKKGADTLLYLASLADPEYQAVSERISTRSPHRPCRKTPGDCVGVLWPRRLRQRAANRAISRFRL